MGHLRGGSDDLTDLPAVEEGGDAGGAGGAEGAEDVGAGAGWVGGITGGGEGECIIAIEAGAGG